MTGFFKHLSDITKIHQRAAFVDVERRITPKESAFLKLAGERYSCRSFASTEITNDEIDKIVEAARLAPSAQNRQPFHIWAVKDHDALEKIKEATRYTYDAPLIFIVAYREKDAWVRKYDGHNAAATDAAIVTTHLMLQAADLGLGTTWVASFDPARLKELFPELSGYEPFALLPTGHPSDTSSPSPSHTERRPLSSLLTKI
ncbi:MAG: nitroreductase family protein [Bacteroidales bacterium]|nr:nitroreductase family protein [Bacteroidales bacterium]